MGWYIVKILTFSSLYPNAVQPAHGIFVETRLRHLVAAGTVRARVVAPVPWFPSGAAVFGQYGRLARVPAQEERNGLSVVHPRYPVIPKVGMSAAPFLMAASTLPAVRRAMAEGWNFDVLDAHYFYPDGVAAALIAGRIGKPFVITARGTDLNLIPRYRLPRAMIRWAAGRADGLITVCAALADSLVELGVPRERIHVLRNGVDLDRFRPGGREISRRNLGCRGPTLASVGHLVERKGHHLVLRALAELPDIHLLIAGDGPMRDSLRTLAADLGVTERVRFLGELNQAELTQVYNAADALVLASDREGMANVLLEAMACGCPVVATAIWGTPEIVDRPEAGRLVHARTPPAITAAVRELFAAPPSRAATRAHAERFGWNETTRGQEDLFRRILETRGAR